MYNDRMSLNATARESNVIDGWIHRCFGCSRRASIEYIVLFLVFVFAMPSMTSLIVGGTIGVIGLLLRVWTAGFGYNIGEISFAGPYRFVRHPYFLGSTLVLLGLCVGGRHPYVMLASILLVALAYRSDVLADEERLKANLGSEFIEYRASVPAFLPQLWPARVPESVRNSVFSLRYSLLAGRHREIDTVVGLACGFGLLYLCFWMTNPDKFRLAAAIVGAIYVVGRLLYFMWPTRYKN